MKISGRSNQTDVSKILIGEHVGGCNVSERMSQWCSGGSRSSRVFSTCDTYSVW